MILLIYYFMYNYNYYVDVYLCWFLVAFFMESNRRCNIAVEFASAIKEAFERKTILIKIAIWFGAWLNSI